MKRLGRALLALLSLAGCSHRGSEPVRGPDGEPNWWAVTCSHGTDNCWQEAAERCPTGYVTADEHHAVTTRFGGVLKDKSEMLIKCTDGRGAPRTAER